VTHSWVELVFGARAAGLTVVAKAIQLWNVGAGLPLDALKKGTIVEWTCPYLLDPSEISPLLDALSKNGSLTYLNLAPSGITWAGGGSTGLRLVEKMAHSVAALSALQKIVIRLDGYEIPVARLREPETSMAAIKEGTFFSPTGPRRDEVRAPPARPPSGYTVRA
jgi:hypothetical protein